MKKLYFVVLVSIIFASCESKEDSITPEENNKQLASVYYSDSITNNPSMSGTYIYDYDESGNLISESDYRESETRYTFGIYNEDNKITDLHFGNPETEGYTYTYINGKLSKSTRFYGDEITTRTYSYTNNEILEQVNNEWDSYSRVYTIEDGNIVHIKYNAEKEWLSWESTITYDNQPNFTNGDVSSLKLPYNNVAGFTNKNNPIKVDGGFYGKVTDYTYEYDNEGFVTSVNVIENLEDNSEFRVYRTYNWVINYE